jgi:hypothetical protein
MAAYITESGFFKNFQFSIKLLSTGGNQVRLKKKPKP